MTRSRFIAVAVASTALTLFCIPACSDIGRPMDEPTLVSLIVDLHLLEARRELVADAHPTLRDSVLAVHGVSHDEFQDAILYYSDRPDDYVSLYNRVIDSLSAEQAMLEEQGVIGLGPPP